MADWADIAAPIHFSEPVDANALRHEPEMFGLAKWFYEQNAKELTDGSIVALGWQDCLTIARTIYECDEPWTEHPAKQFAELLTKRLEAILAAPTTGTPTESV